MVILIVLTSRRMQTVTNYFIANLALADVVIGLFSVPFQFQVGNSFLNKKRFPFRNQIGIVEICS